MPHSTQNTYTVHVHVRAGKFPRVCVHSPQNSLSVDDKETSERVTGIFEIDAVIFGDLVRQIGKKRDVERTQSAVFSRRLDPS